MLAKGEKHSLKFTCFDRNGIWGRLKTRVNVILGFNVDINVATMLFRLPPSCPRGEKLVELFAQLFEQLLAYFKCPGQPAKNLLKNSTWKKYNFSTTTSGKFCAENVGNVKPENNAEGQNFICNSSVDCNFCGRSECNLFWYFYMTDFCLWSQHKIRLLWRHYTKWKIWFPFEFYLVVRFSLLND